MELEITVSDEESPDIADSSEPETEAGDEVSNFSQSTANTDFGSSQKSSTELNSSQKAKRPRISELDEDEETLCAICLDEWTNFGEHRICALKCGHLFGNNCILRWIHMNKNCPSCKKMAKKKDIWFIITNEIKTECIPELEEIDTALDTLNKKLSRLEIEDSENMILISILEEEYELYQYKLQKQASIRRRDKLNAQILKMKESVNLCESGSCRVMDMHGMRRKFVVSMKSQNNALEDFGIKKFSDYFRPLDYVHLHTKPIRDLKFNVSNDSLLSVALDNVVKTTDVHNNQQIGAYDGEKMMWSCCWDAGNPNYFYVGQQQSSITKFDIRRITEPIDTYHVTGDMSPVISIVSLSSNSNSVFPSGGFIACTLNSITAFEAEDSTTYNSLAIPADGPFTSMSLHFDKQKLLISSRPNTRTPHTRHRVYSLEKHVGDDSSCKLVHTFQGGGLQSLMSRSCFWDKAQDDLYVVAQQDKMISLWNVNSGMQRLPAKCYPQIIDLMPVSNASDEHLLALTQNKLFIYKFADA